MGTSHDYICNQCGLKGHVSGGTDAGLMACVKTMYCDQCDKLVNVVTDWTGAECHGEAITEEDKKSIGRCDCGHCPTIAWNHGDPCPKCNGTVECDEGVTSMWD